MPKLSKESSRLSTGSSVSLIPAQSTNLATLSSKAAHHGPLYRMCRDTGILSSMLYLLPNIFLPFGTKDPSDELYMHPPNTAAMFILVFVTILQGLLAILAIPAFIVLPGLLIAVLLLLGNALIVLICSPIQGPTDVTPSEDTLAQLDQDFPHERWFFLNGCCVSGPALQGNINRLALTFGRPIRGVHNRTYGLIGDLTECVIQRAFGYYTKETRYAYEYVKAYCADPDVDKVVLIAHSQGGIMASNILDQLFADLGQDEISKLEVYTFGNAADHFSNPLRRGGGAGTPTDKRRRVIPHIEHYANSDDLVTRWGVLYSVQNLVDNRFCGQVFVHQGASGHMLNQHYLSVMFPLPGQEPTKQEGVDAVPFLEQTVSVDENIQKRRWDAAEKQKGIMRTESMNIFNVLKEVNGSRGTSPTRTGTGHLLKGVEGRINIVQSPPEVEEDEDEGHQVTGKTVRELSRLWRYMGGGGPDAS
ncbi:MAG: hypothetical protein Q9227_005468 [Pyrenula ochraceoflavens]